MEGKEGVGLDGSGLLLQRTPVTHSVFLRLCRSVKVGGLAPRRVLHFGIRRWSVPVAKSTNYGRPKFIWGGEGMTRVNQQSELFSFRPRSPLAL